MTDGQAQTTPVNEPQSGGARTYLVFRYVTGADLKQAFNNGTFSDEDVFLLPVGDHDADSHDDAIKAIARRDDAANKEHAAVPVRYFRRRMPHKRVVWGFDD